jgi:hypothetical protein
MSQMQQPKASSLTGRIVLAVIFLIASLGVMALFLWAFQPRHMPPYSPPYTQYDPQTMNQAVSVESIEEINNEILAQGSRFPGLPGHKKVRDLIRRRYEQAGLEIIEQEFSGVTPVTEIRKILDDQGQDVEGVEIYPFLPNHAQPVAMGDEGLDGKLLLVNDEILANGSGFDDCFAVVDLKNKPANYGYKWHKYAILGFKGVIFSHSEGLDKIDWGSDELAETSSTIPVNYPRMLANPAIFRHADKQVNIRLRVRWKNVDNANLIGVLKAGKPSRNDALLLIANYDAPSYTPDLSHGPMLSVQLATHLALLEGLKAYQDELRRDVIFIAMGARSLSQVDIIRIGGCLGPVKDMGSGRELHQELLEKHQQRLDYCKNILPLFDNPGFFADGAETEKLLAGLDDATRSFLDDQVKYILNDRVAELTEPTLQARLAFIRLGREDIDSEEFHRFRENKDKQQSVLMIAGYTLTRALDTMAKEGNEDLRSLVDLRARATERFTELNDYHTRQVRRETVNLQINALISGYSNTVALLPRPLPKLSQNKTDVEESVGILMGPSPFSTPGWRSYWQGRADQVNAVTYRVSQDPQLPESFQYQPYTGLTYFFGINKKVTGPTAISSHWSSYGYTIVELCNLNRVDSYNKVALPVIVPEARQLGDLSATFLFTGKTALSLAFGNGEVPTGAVHQPATKSGTVYLSGVGRSIVPSHTLKDAIVCNRNSKESVKKGAIQGIMLWTNPYGEYLLPLNLGNFGGGTNQKGYSPLALAFDRYGKISHMKDAGPQAQAIFDSTNRIAKGPSARDVNIIVFRAAPTAILDMVNPQTYKAFSGANWITREGLSDFRSFCVFESQDSYWMNFLPPDEKFYVELKAGSPENELVQEVRAFLLNIQEGWEQPKHSTREIDGPGYLAADTPIIQDVPFHIAHSMIWLNGKRLLLQKKYDMQDERMVAYHKQAEEMLEAAQQPGLSKREQLLRASEACTYAMLNHPPLRENIREAVISIIWYLCLLVPFGFFFEKLLFGFTDVRKQIAAQGVIFVVAFFLLYVLHPAFAMIRSALMILLGFIIILISAGITVLFSGKFKENFEQLKAKRGQVSAAEVNMMGVVGTAFMLGLNNMHRRKIRTGLTCATLVLITFAMICFTSTQSDVVDSEVAISKAAYQGMLIKQEDLRPITSDEIFALNQRYGEEYIVAKREMLVGLSDPNTSKLLLPEIAIKYLKNDREVNARSVLVFGEKDPLAQRIAGTCLTRRDDPMANWFPEGSGKEEIKPILLPADMAQRLQISMQTVESGDAIVELAGKKFRVHGIFSPERYGAIVDLDGEPVLPIDIESMRNINRDKSLNVLAVEPFSYIDPSQVIIGVDFGGVTFGEGLKSLKMEPRIASAAIWLIDKHTKEPLAYREARAMIDAFLEQSGRKTYYGLDKIAYRGQRARQTSLAGLMDMVIPLIIAALTVLNTIRGSVYERRDEIFVYNAVGIAPRYVFFMFFAEAFVYAVVGSVLGYLLSQGTGRTLTLLNLTGGLNMTFTTSTTILASLAIMAATFLSTLFPALKAMDIAAPAEESGWDIPEPEGDSLILSLPFTFDAKDRLAVIEFFHRFFLEHGEGSSSSFFCSDPDVGLCSQTDPLADGAYVPELRCTVWLKPFDLGVSQELSISLPTDPQTKEYVAHLELQRLSGTRESWLRLNYGFLKGVRKHFLHWRAVSTHEREEMFQKARDLIQQQLPAEGAHNG